MKKMAAALYHLLLVFLLTGEAFSQCYNSTGCTGSLVGAVNQRDCCVGTNDGLSFSDGGICTNCIGIDSVTSCQQKLTLASMSCSLLSCTVYVVDEDARLDTEF